MRVLLLLCSIINGVDLFKLEAETTSVNESKGRKLKNYASTDTCGSPDNPDEPEEGWHVCTASDGGSSCDAGCTANCQLTSTGDTDYSTCTDHPTTSCDAGCSMPRRPPYPPGAAPSPSPPSPPPTSTATIAARWGGITAGAILLVFVFLCIPLCCCVCGYRGRVTNNRISQILKPEEEPTNAPVSMPLLPLDHY